MNAATVPLPHIQRPDSRICVAFSHDEPPRCCSPAMPVAAQRFVLPYNSVMTTASPIPKDLTACPDCDLLLHTDDATHDRQGHCPRCDALLWDVSNHARDIDFAAAISGLLLFVPAVTLPILHFSMAGQHGSNSLIDGVWRLWQESEQLLAVLILLCSVVAPLVHMLLAATIGLCQRLQRYPNLYPQWLKWHNWMRSWSMLEVYAMGIIVAYVKMMHDGDVAVAPGTYCLSALLLCIILCNQYFSEEQAWQCWEQRTNA